MNSVKDGDAFKSRKHDELESLVNLMDNISDISHCGPGNSFHQRPSLDNLGAQHIKSPTSPNDFPFATSREE